MSEPTPTPDAPANSTPENTPKAASDPKSAPAAQPAPAQPVAAAPDTARPVEPFPSKPTPPPTPTAPPPTPELLALFKQFRQDMAAAGLHTYDCTDVMLGRAYKGPAVNVRDPGLATRATRLTLVTHAIAAQTWRMYPVLAPLEL